MSPNTHYNPNDGLLQIHALSIQSVLLYCVLAGWYQLNQNTLWMPHWSFCFLVCSSCSSACAAGFWAFCFLASCQRLLPPGSLFLSKQSSVCFCFCSTYRLLFTAFRTRLNIRGLFTCHMKTIRKHTDVYRQSGSIWLAENVPCVEHLFKDKWIQTYRSGFCLAPSLTTLQRCGIVS